MAEFSLTTERLVLREWRDEDYAPYSAMSRDVEVMRHLGPVQDDSAIAEMFERQRRNQANLGHCCWIVERLSDRAMLGFCGLEPTLPRSPIAGQVDLGWRLARNHWGHGYAFEAARASLEWGWKNLVVEGLWGMTVLANTRSWTLMERLGMSRRYDLDFDHPYLAEQDPLRPQIVYEARRDEIRSNPGA